MRPHQGKRAASAPISADSGSDQVDTHEAAALDKPQRWLRSGFWAARRAARGSSLRSHGPPASAGSPSTATSPPGRSSWTPSWPTRSTRPTRCWTPKRSTSPASDALSRLIRSSWRIVDRHRSLLAATHRDLPAARIRQHHDQVMARVERLIARGQDEGDFRTDLPAPGWWRPSTA
jgi:hypothetical protein